MSTERGAARVPDPASGPEPEGQAEQGGPPGPEGPTGPEVRDPGAQPERTRLAWRRTTLTFAVSVGLCIRHVLGGDRGAVTAGLSAAAALAWLAFLAVAHRRIAGMAACRPAVMSAGVVRAAAVCTLLMVAAGIGMTLAW